MINAIFLKTLEIPSCILSDELYTRFVLSIYLLNETLQIDK